MAVAALVSVALAGARPWRGGRQGRGAQAGCSISGRKLPDVATAGPASSLPQALIPRPAPRLTVGLNPVGSCGDGVLDAAV